MRVLCETSDEPTRRLLAQHGVLLKERIGGGSLSAVIRSRRHVAQALRGMDVLHVHTVRSLAVIAMLGPVRSWRRSVSTIHNPHQRSAVLMYLARRIVSLSDANRAHVRRSTLRLRNPAVILNATLGTPRLRSIHALVPVKLPPDSILFVGALHRRKGLDVLLDAMPMILRRVPDARLYVVGNRDDPGFERGAEERGVAHAAHFVGFVPDPRTYMLSASVFVLPSRQEGFGNVLTEARECGTPIVATRVGGIPEALSGGRAGLMVEPQAPSELADAIVSVLTDPNVAADLRRATQIDLDDMRTCRAEREYAEVYADVLPGRSGLLWSSARAHA